VTGGKLKAGARDRKITLQRRGGLVDAFGHEAETWSDLGVVWAERLDVSDGEKWRAAEVAAAISVRFRVLRSTLTAGLGPKDRILSEGQVFDIQGIKQLDRSGFEITANARADL
jgi:head-tail adaptor